MFFTRVYPVIASVSKQSIRLFRRFTPRNDIYAFTLIELLIVIAIIAILGSATVLVLNPIELMKQGRDGTRIADAENIQKSIAFTLFNNPILIDSIPATNIYLSLPSGSCPTNPPAGYSYVCNATAANINKIDGTGWIPLNLQNIAALPIDPTQGSNANYYYAFVADPTTKTYVITTLLESEKQTKVASVKDGGTDSGRFEKGNVSLWTRASGLQGYWKFDGSGSIANGQTAGLQDISGNGNNGTAGNVNGTGMSFVAGLSGNAVQLDGADDYVSVSHNATLMPASITVSGWIDFSLSQSWMMINKAPGGTSGSYYIYGGAGSGTWSIFGPTGTRYDCYLGSVSPGKWYHLVGTLDATTGQQKCYFNGDLKGTVNGAALGSNTNPVYIGNYGPGSGYQVGGMIDGVRIYNRALSAEEVRGIYNANK